MNDPDAGFGSLNGALYPVPVDPDSLSVGEKVGITRYFRARFTCTVTGGETSFGVGTMPSPASYAVPGTSTVFTTPALEALGLGYYFWWNFGIDGTDFTNTVTRRMDTVTGQTLPPFWISRDTGTYTLTVQGHVDFVKIGPMPDTGGAETNISVPFSVVRLYVAEQSAPSTPVGTPLHVQRTLQRFTSAKRACTPTVSMNQTIMFPTLYETDLPNPTDTSTDKEFTLKWNCPYMAYNTSGFTIHAAHGYADEAQGIIKIKPGTGYAQGIGIQIEGYGLRTGWGGNHPAAWLPAKPDTFYTFKAVDYDRSLADTVNGMTENRDVEQKFRARLYRLNEPLVPGIIQSSILIHMVYR